MPNHNVIAREAYLKEIASIAFITKNTTLNEITFADLKQFIYHAVLETKFPSQDPENANVPVAIPVVVQKPEQVIKKQVVNMSVEDIVAQVFKTPERHEPKLQTLQQGISAIKLVPIERLGINIILTRLSTIQHPSIDAISKAVHDPKQLINQTKFMTREQFKGIVNGLVKIPRGGSKRVTINCTTRVVHMFGNKKRVKYNKQWISIKEFTRLAQK